MKTISKLLSVWILCSVCTTAPLAQTMESVTFANHYFEFVGAKRALPGGLAADFEPYKLLFFQNGRLVAVDPVLPNNFRDEKSVEFEHFNLREPMTVMLQLPYKTLTARCLSPTGLFHEPDYTRVSYDVQLTADNKTLICTAMTE